MMCNGLLSPPRNLAVVYDRCADLDHVIDEPRCIESDKSNNFAIRGINTFLILVRV